MDRDGVLNAAFIVDSQPKPPKTLSEIRILDGVKEAVVLLKQHDFIPVVVTNQPDVSRGTTSKTQIEQINHEIGRLTGISNFYTCFHDDDDLCECRKPKPGLLLSAARDLQLSLSESFLVGDRWRDIGAGNNAGVQSYFIDYSYGERPPQPPFTRVSSLQEAVELAIGGIK